MKSQSSGPGNGSGGLLKCAGELIGPSDFLWKSFGLIECVKQLKGGVGVEEGGGVREGGETAV